MILLGVPINLFRVYVHSSHNWPVSSTYTRSLTLLQLAWRRLSPHIFMLASIQVATSPVAKHSPHVQLHQLLAHHTSQNHRALSPSSSPILLGIHGSDMEVVGDIYCIMGARSITHCMCRNLFWKWVGGWNSYDTAGVDSRPSSGRILNPTVDTTLSRWLLGRNKPLFIITVTRGQRLILPKYSTE